MLFVLSPMIWSLYRIIIVRRYTVEHILIQLSCFFSQSRTYSWNTCPEGYFLQGFYNPKDLLLDHETATCCRPRNFKNTPAHPTDCEDNYVNNLIGREGWWRCKEWFYLTAVYQDNCDKTGCTEFFTCCRMPPSGTSSFPAPDVKLNLQLHRHKFLTRQNLKRLIKKSGLCKKSLIRPKR